MAILYNSNYDETIPFSDTCGQGHLTANIAESYTVPGGPTNKYQALFTYNDQSNVFVRLNATPSPPVANTIGLQKFNEFKPHKRYVQGGDVIQFVTPDANAYFGISLRSLT